MKYPKILILKTVSALFSLLLTVSISAQFDPPPSVIINEISYRTESPGDFTEYIELYNTTSSPINIGGWFLDDAISYQIPANTTIQGDGFVIIAQNVADFNDYFSNNGAPVRGPWSGALRNSGEDIVLRDASFDKIDEVDYDNWNEWPSTGHLEDNLSLQLVNINLPGNHGGSWDAADHTPGAFNSAVFINNPNQRPIIQNVRRSPDSPLSTDEVRVRAELDIDNLSLINGLQVVLEYKKLSPGNFEPKSSPFYNMGWTSVNMLDNGIGADSTANNGVFTAVIPASAHSHRDLVRYRVNISNNSGFDMTYPDQNYDECNYAYYVYNGYPAQGGIDLNSLPQIQDFTVFTTAQTTSVFIGDDEGDHIGGPSGIDQYEDDEFLGTGAVVYDGRVYDHVNFRPRGGGSRSQRVKPGIRFRMNREHSFETQDDCGNTYDVDRGRMVLSGGWVHDPGAHGLTESLIYKTIELVGGIERNANYTQLRIVDDAQETGNKGDFWGLYLILENYNGDLIDERNQLEEGNFWNTDRGVNGRQRNLNFLGHFPDSETIDPWAGPAFFNSGNGRLAMDNDLNLEMMFADRISNVIYGQQGTNYIGKHSYNEYYNSVTGKYFAWWSDMDNSFGADQDFEDNPVFTRDQCDPNRHLDNRIYVTGGQQIAYQNQMRSVYDLLLSDEQIDFLIDQEKGLVHTDGTSDDWMEVDQARWGHVYDATSPTSPNQTADAHVDWYRQWFRDRRDYMEMNDGPHLEAMRDNYDTPDHIYDPNIPTTPVLTKLNPTNAIDELDFRRSAYEDPNGDNTYEAQEWRIAEWSDPSNPFYIERCTPHYEIEPTWESGEILSTSRDFSFDDAVSELEPGRTYKVRVRVMDNSGRWSHWSNAITLIAEEAITPTVDNIVISEIHYNPALGCAEFVEIYNNSNSTINLSNYSFSDGLDFVFPVGSSIAAGDYKIIVEDIACFNAAFNVPSQDILGEFDDGGLSNGGEEVKLQAPDGTQLDSVKYDDDLPWDTLADNGLHSLALIDLQLDNDIAVNWATQCVSVTPAAPNNFNGCNTLPDLSSIVINEIKYSGGPNNLEFIELKNTGNTPVDIQGMQVSGVELQILDSHIIPPGGFIILAEDSASVALNYSVSGAIQYPGRLSNTGETITLTDFFGNMIDAVSYSSGFPWPITGSSDQSIGLIDCNLDNNTFVNWAIQNQLVTPLAENTFGANVVADYSNLIINEIHYATEINDRAEFIEIYNTGFQPIFLAGLHFSNFNFTFSESDILFGNSYFVIAEFANDFTNAFGFAPDASWEGAGSGLEANGELITILDFFGNEVDRVNYSPSWDPRSDDGLHSLALRPNQTNNNIASAWSTQCDFVTPKAVNNFDDDDDTICNDVDVCPNFDDTEIGTVCDDGDPCTLNDVVTSNCNCVGTPTADSDNDGVCDALDVCPTLDDNIIGTACDDGDDCTSDDTWNSSCSCAGTPIADSDNDGVCDIFDNCPNFDDNLIGTSCDDGDPCTPANIYSNCACETVENVALNGTASQSSTLLAFNASRLNDGNAPDNNSSDNIAHTAGDTANDWMQIDLGSDILISSVVLYNRIGCCRDRINNAFVMISNTPFPGNTNLSQSLNNATAFEQLRDESTKDIIGVDFNIIGRYIRIQKSGNNEGNSDALNLREIEVYTPFTVSDIDNDGICDALDTCDIMIGQPCDDNIVCFTGSTYDANCNCTGGVFTDSDNDGVCDALDQCPGLDDSIDSNNNNIPDCTEECQDSLIQTDFPLIQTNRSVNNDISTNGSVLSGFDVEYNAGVEIRLTPGFEVSENAVFHAFISPCSN